MTMTTKNNTSSSQLTTQCYVMPLFNSSIDNKIKVQDNAITCIDFDSQQKFEFLFDNIFVNQHEFLKSSFKKTVAPLVQETIKGESTMVIFGGLQSLKSNEFMLSHTVMQDLISQAAGHLLNSINQGNEKIGSVTFSWFKIQCTTPEIIVDVLKTASNTTSSTPNVNSSQKSAKQQVNESNSLVLRELGKGRGMIVPGLWEVEISSTGDIEAVVNHLQKIIPDTADHSIGNAHTIMQLTVTNHQVNTNKSSQLNNQTNAAVIVDPPGVGRITFLLLSNLFPIAPPTRTPVYPLGTPIAYYSWVEQLRMVMKILENYQSTPMFHKSRLLLLLKDVLLRKQKAALILLVQPTLEQQQVNMEWLKLVGQLSSIKNLNVPSDILQTQTTSHNTISHSLQTPSNRSVTPTNRDTSIPSNRVLAQNSRLSQPTTNPNSLYQSSVYSSAAAVGMNTSSTTSVLSTAIFPSSSVSSTGGITNNNSINDTVSKQQYSNRMNSSFVATTTSHTNSQNNSNSILPITNKDSDSMYFTKENASLQSFYNQNINNNNQNNNYSNSEKESALQMALEASRSEANALKIAVKYSTEKYQEVKEAYESLLSQLKEDGAFLAKRDQTRYRTALKDIKDYEIYKEVMEAAMIRMQQELESYVEETQSIKNKKVSEDKNIKKQKEFSDKYSKDLVATKKKLHELEIKNQSLEKQVKVLSRERESSIASLVHYKSEGVQRETQLKYNIEQYLNEMSELHQKLKLSEDKCIALETDKAAILATNATEAVNLRSAHSKALEMLMGYQEENDVLRSAVSEMSDTVTKSNDNLKSLSIPSMASISGNGGIAIEQYPLPPYPPPTPE